MAVVSKNKLGAAVQNCRQLEEAILKIVLFEAGDTFEIRVAFDRHWESWLQKSIQEKRGQGLEVKGYEVADNTLPFLIVVVS